MAGKKNTPVKRRKQRRELIPVFREGVLWFYYDSKTMRPAGTYGPPISAEMSQSRLIEEVHAYADADPTMAKCYFIGGDDGAIKIGYSIDPASRLMGLQTGSPIPLRILATCSGGASRENAYHGQFAEFRVYGEWFERSPEILAEIARLNEQVPA